MTADEAAALGTLFKTNYADLCDYALRFVGSRASAEDLVQDLFLALWEAHGADEAARVDRAYLYRAVRNRAINYLRRHRVAESWVEYASRQEPPGDPTPEDMRAQRDLEAAAQRAIAELPDRCREVFLLCRRDGLSYAEVAERLRLSINTVQSQMWRAGKQLREKLAPYLG